MKKYTATHRIIHWVIAISMFVLLATGFLRMYWMGRKTISAAINNELRVEAQRLNYDENFIANGNFNLPVLS